MITKSSILEIQNLIVNPKSIPVKSNTEQYKFLFKYVSSKKTMTKFFKIKNPILGSFLPKEIFP